MTKFYKRKRGRGRTTQTVNPQDFKGHPNWVLVVQPGERIFENYDEYLEDEEKKKPKKPTPKKAPTK